MECVHSVARKETSTTLESSGGRHFRSSKPCRSALKRDSQLAGAWDPLLTMATTPNEKAPTAKVPHESTLCTSHPRQQLRTPLCRCQSSAAADALKFQASIPLRTPSRRFQHTPIRFRARADPCNSVLRSGFLHQASKPRHSSNSPTSRERRTMVLGGSVQRPIWGPMGPSEPKNKGSGRNIYSGHCRSNLCVLPLVPPSSQSISTSHPQAAQLGSWTTASVEVE